MDFKEFKRLYLAYPKFDKNSGYMRFYHAFSRVNDKFNAMNITMEEYQAYITKFIPELTEYHANRKRLTEDLQNKDSKYFAEIPQEQKLNYLEAFIEGKRKDDEWKDLAQNKNLVHNLQSCLYRIKPSDEQIKEERYLMKRFMNFLVFSGFKEKLKDNDGDVLFAQWDHLAKEEKKNTIEHFIYCYEQIYGIDKIQELKFVETMKKGQKGSYYENDNTISLSVDVLEKDAAPIAVFSTLFHELTHARQAKLYCENPEEYRIFNPSFHFIKEPLLQYNNEVNGHDFYELSSREMNAYFFEYEFENMMVDEIWEGKIRNKAPLGSSERCAAITNYYRREGR